MHACACVDACCTCAASLCMHGCLLHQLRRDGRPRMGCRVACQHAQSYEARMCCRMDARPAYVVVCCTVCLRRSMLALLQTSVLFVTMPHTRLRVLSPRTRVLCFCITCRIPDAQTVGKRVSPPHMRSSCTHRTTSRSTSVADSSRRRCRWSCTSPRTKTRGHVSRPSTILQWPHSCVQR